MSNHVVHSFLSESFSTGYLHEEPKPLHFKVIALKMQAPPWFLMLPWSIHPEPTLLLLQINLLASGGLRCREMVLAQWTNGTELYASQRRDRGTSQVPTKLSAQAQGDQWYSGAGQGLLLISWGNNFTYRIVFCFVL